MPKLPVQVQVILFFRNKDKIEYLLLKRLPERGGFWQPITGGVEDGENLLYSARREVMEEAGYLKVIAMYDLRYHFQFNFKDKVIDEYVYAFEVPHQNVIFSPEEHSEIRWVNYEEALSLLKWDTNQIALKKIHHYLLR
jgi:dATP pyrophosphohydrolase